MLAASEAHRVEAEIAKRDLVQFCVTQSEGRWRTSPHLELIASLLMEAEAHAADESEDEPYLLVISTPPRHGKSELISRNFPAWFLGRNQDLEFILASYGADLALDMSRDARQIYLRAAETYGWPDISRDSSAVARWHLDGRKGKLQAAGVGGPLTGRGGHCFPAGTVIETVAGPVPIERVDVHGRSGVLWAYDETAGSIIRRANAVSVREVEGLYRITTASGRVVEATGEHPFYVDGEYKSAASLAPGDRFLCAMREGSCAGGIRSEQAHKARTDGVLLLEQLLVPACERKARIFTAEMPDVREGNIPKGTRETPILLSRMQEDRDLSKMRAEEEPPRHTVQAMRESIPAAQPQNSVLFCRLRETLSCFQDARREQSILAQRSEPVAVAASLGKGIPGDTAQDFRERRLSMRRMRIDRTPPDSSHQHERRGQQMDESRDNVLKTSHAATRRGKIETETDTVAVVEYIRGKSVVYNLQVGGPQNFFANGILVHNCIVIDDPIKNIDDGESLIVQRRIWDWYRSTLRTRLAPGGAIVLLMTRWHEGDLAGRLIREMGKGGEQWKVVSLPALALADDPLGRAPGEALWPWRYNEKALAATKRGMGGRLWGALFQQDPTADVEGALWDKETMIDPFREEIVIEALEEIVVAVDPSGSGAASSDLCGIVVCGRRPDGHGVVLYDASDRYEPDEWGTRALELCLEFKTDRIVAERNFGYMLVKRNIEVSAATWEGEEIKGENVEIDLVNASRGKYQRADPVANLYKQGLVHHDTNADLDDLEDEQTQWIGRGPRRSKWSPNRIDAAVWGLTDLMIEGGGGGAEWIDLGD